MSIKHFSLLLAIVPTLVLFSCKQEPVPETENKEENTQQEEPKVEIKFSNISVAGITTDAASFAATVTVTNVTSSIIAYFYYGESATSLGKTGSQKSKETILKSSGGSFNQAVTGLKKNTTYFYVAAVTIDGEETLSDIKSFDTANTPSEVYTGDYSNVTETTATLGGSVVITGDAASAKYGIQYTTASDKSYAKGKIVYAKAHDSAGGFTVDVTDLTEGTSYIFRAFIFQDNKYTYGESKAFKTKESSKVVTVAASEIDIRKAIVKVEYHNRSTATNITVGVCISDTYKTADDLYNQGDKTEGQTTYIDGTYTVTYSRLDGQTTYYYVGYIIISGNIIFGNVRSFKTKDLVGHIIEYTTTDGATTDLYGSLGEGVLLVSNTYTGGVGKAVLNNPVEYMDRTFIQDKTLKTAKVPQFSLYLLRTFQECTALESVSIPESVIAIGEYTFYKCTSLESIELPSNLTEVYHDAFNTCSSLKTIVFPAGMTKLGTWCIASCTSLESITVKATNPPTLEGALYYNSDMKPTIYVPAASVDAYKAADNWSAYSEQIVGY